MSASKKRSVKTKKKSLTKQPDWWFHASPSVNRESIERLGLRPAPVYLFAYEDLAIDYAENFMFEGDDIDVWAVDLPKMRTKPDDEFFVHGDAVKTTRGIVPRRLEIIGTVHGGRYVPR